MACNCVANHGHSTGQSKVAIKAVPKATTSLRDFLIEFHYSYFLSPHPGILDTYDVAFETSEHYCFAQEVAPFGDLWQVSDLHQMIHAKVRYDCLLPHIDRL